MGSAAAAPGSVVVGRQGPRAGPPVARRQGRQGGRMTQPVTGSVQLRVDDVTVDLPRLPATAGNDGVVVSALLKETGLVTVDPGFMNTASCTSDITYIDGDQGILLYRGYPIEQLAVLGELTVDEQVCDLKEGRVLGQLLDRVAAVEQDALVAVDVGDVRGAWRGVHEAGVDRDKAGLLEQGGDHDAVVAGRGRQAGQVQGQVIDAELDRSGHGLGHASSLSTLPAVNRGSCTRACSPTTTVRGPPQPTPSNWDLGPSLCTLIGHGHHGGTAARSSASKADGEPPCRAFHAPVNRAAARAIDSSDAVRAMRTWRAPAGP